MPNGTRVNFLHQYGPYVLGFVLLFVVWHVSAAYLVRSVLFPSPISVIGKAIELMYNRILFEQLGVSLFRILGGFILGTAIGIPVGLIMGNFPFMKKVLEPFTEFLRFIPSVAMITVAVIWFGIGEASKIFLIAYTTVFIVIINTAAGVLGIHQDKLRAARTLGATSSQIFFHVSVPAAMPEILTGLRIAMGNSFTTIVAAEMIAADRGLGQMLWTGRLFMLIDEIFVSLLALGLLGFTVDRLFRTAIHRFGGKYSAVA